MLEEKEILHDCCFGIDPLILALFEEHQKVSLFSRTSNTHFFWIIKFKCILELLEANMLAER